MKNFNTLLTLSELKEHYGNPPVGICPLYNGILDKIIVGSKTGNPIVLPPYKGITSLNISFSPQQAGTGDPSPENVRPISGYDSATVNVRGKNLVNLETQTFTQIKNVSLEDEIPAGSYVLSANVQTNSGDNRCLVNFLDAENALVFSAYMPVSSESSYAVTLSRHVKIISMFAARNNALSIGRQATFSDIQLEVGSTPTPYESYQPGTTTTLNFPETIYGGTVDAVTGEGSKTWGFIASYNGEALPGEWISDRDAYTAGTTPTTGAQVAYKLATPEPFKVNPISIPSLSGINTIYSDADNLSCYFKISSFWSDAD